jgi:hypothetical protein
MRSANPAPLKPWHCEWRDSITEDGESLSWHIDRDERLTLLSIDITQAELDEAYAAWWQLFDAERIEWQKARLLTAPVR